MFSLIYIIIFYYVINKLIILVSDPHTNLIPVHRLKYLSIGTSLFLTIRFR
jgi:hypothetical protein